MTPPFRVLPQIETEEAHLSQTNSICTERRPKTTVETVHTCPCPSPEFFINILSDLHVKPQEIEGIIMSAPIFATSRCIQD